MDFYSETIGPQQFVGYIATSAIEGCPLSGVSLYMNELISLYSPLTRATLFTKLQAGCPIPSSMYHAWAHTICCYMACL